MIIIASAMNCSGTDPHLPKEQKATTTMTTPLDTKKSLLLALVASVGCDPLVDNDVRTDDFGVGDVAERGCKGCGVLFNTNSIIAGEFDATSQVYARARLVRVRLLCMQQVEPRRFPDACAAAKLFTLEKVWAEEGQLRGTAAGLAFNAGDFYKSEWDFEVYNGKGTQSLSMTVSAYSHVAPDPLFYYTFTSSGKTVCATTLDPISHKEVGPKSVVLENLTVDTTTGMITEREGTLYIACVSGAVGKAVTWGYKPWDIGLTDFTTAVRVVRADYCGDGDSWTIPGTPIQIQDVWSYHGFFNPAGKTEAIWGDQGAVCLETRRVADDTLVACKGGKQIVPCASKTLASFPAATMWTKLP